MSKILDCFDYVFYRCYRFFSSHRFFRGMEKDDSIGMIFLLFFIPTCALIGAVYYYTGTKFERYSLQTYTYIAFIFLIEYAPLLHRYSFNKSISKDKYQVFKDRWRKEDRKQRKKRGWYIVLLIVNNLLVFPLVVMMLIHHFF